MHDPDPGQSDNIISERFTHPADLPVQSLGQHNAECPASLRDDLARQGHGIEYGYARHHGPDKIIRDGTVDFDPVFFLVTIASAQDFINNIAIVGQKNQAFRIPVESADREDPLGVPEEIDDIVSPARISCRGDSDWLVKSQIDQIIIRQDRFTFDPYGLASQNTAANQGDSILNRDQTFSDQAVRFTATAVSRICQVFIDPGSSHFTLIRG